MDLLKITSIENSNIAKIISDHIKRTSDPFEITRDFVMDAVADLRKASDGAMQAASYSGEALRMLTRGQLKVNMEMLGAEAPLLGASRIMNRLAMAVIIAGLFIGSSIIAPYGGDFDIFGVPFVSFFGFLGAFVLSVWVVIDIWRHH